MAAIMRRRSSLRSLAKCSLPRNEAIDIVLMKGRAEGNDGGGRSDRELKQTAGDAKAT
jgi:hypothetical protein